MLISLAGCDIFYSLDKDDDLLARIDGEIAWANAAKLKVIVACPPEWGSSPQSGYSNCGDVRMGFEFDLEFNPREAYSLTEWRAFKTDDIYEAFERVTPPIDWLSDPGYYIDGAAWEITEINDFDSSHFGPNGGRGKMIIRTTEDITLVPWCSDQPRVISTFPPVDNRGRGYWPDQTISINFSVPIDPATAVIAENCITIAARDLDTGGNPVGEKVNAKSYYKAPILSGDQRKITIEAANPTALENREIIVSVGTGIKSLSGKIIAEGLDFSWTTNNPGVTIEDWEVNYNENTGRINVGWAYRGGTPPFTQVYYYQDNGSRQNLAIYGTGAFIGNVQEPDAREVTSGRPISNIHQYEIFIELLEQGEVLYVEGPIKIWNIPGMQGSKANPIREIGSSIQLAAMTLGDTNIQYVLVNDIEISGTDFPNGWMPVGLMVIDMADPSQPDYSKAFMGKFYGNGNSITVNSGFAVNDELIPSAGIFGFTENAEIRDVTVEYADTTIYASGFGLWAGGIGGYLSNTKVRNVITRGLTENAALRVTPSDDIQVILGGIAGLMVGSGIIENCYAGLSVCYNPGGSGSGYMGAVAGLTGEGTGESIKINNGMDNPVLEGLLIDNVVIAANVTADKGDNSGNLGVGGAVGFSEINTVRNVSFIRGTVEFFSSGNGGIDCGGIAGYARGTNFENCAFSGAIGMIPGQSGTVNGETYLGGLVGRYDGIDSYSFINNCWVKGSITFKGSTMKYVGGFMGSSSSSYDGQIIITNCSYDEGHITITGSGASYAGGFIGYVPAGGNLVFYSCGSYAGILTVDLESSDDISAGGFTGSTSGSISNCFAWADIAVRNNNASGVGGFTGYIDTGSTITACYAAGSITLEGGGVAGGLAAFNLGSIENCYALGNVLIDSEGAMISHAGGLVGQLSGGGTVTNCFSAGQVFAKSEDERAYAGGIVGSLQSGTIENCAALGTKVTAAGPDGIRGANRIFGYDNYGGAINYCINNYAINTMLAGSGNYAAYISGELVSSGTGPATAHGENMTEADAMDQNFWKNVAHFEFNSPFPDDASSRAWIFVRGYRYPILAGLPGQ